MTRPDPPGNGGSSRVADEATELMRSLAGLAADFFPGAHSADASSVTKESSVSGPKADGGSDTHAESDATSGNDTKPEGEPDGERESVDAAADQHTYRCGERSKFCGSCPLCRLAETFGAISPETIERVADLLSMAATSLAALAADRRTEQPRSNNNGRADARGEQPPSRPAAATRRSPRRSRDESVDVISADD